MKELNWIKPWIRDCQKIEMEAKRVDRGINPVCDCFLAGSGGWDSSRVRRW